MKKCISILLALSLLCTIGAAFAEGPGAGRGGNGGPGGRQGGMRGGNGSGAGEHMTSFDYAYKLEAVRDWLFAQSR